MKKYFMALVSMGLLSVLSASAAVITEDTWTAAGSLDGWSGTASPRPPGGTAFATLTNTAGFLSITGGTNSGGPPEVDFIGEAGGNLAGNLAYTNVGAIQFSFLANANGTNDLPGGLRVYFISSSTNITWYYDIPSVSAGWNTYYANMNFSGWYNTQGYFTESYFDSSLLDVDEVGIVLQYQGGVDNEIYGLDNFQLLDAPVPEPETYAVLGFALLSLGITFRRRLRDQLAFLRIAGRS
jgi:hypothetical protein